MLFLVAGRDLACKRRAGARRPVACEAEALRSWALEKYDPTWCAASFPREACGVLLSASLLDKAASLAK